MIPDKFRTSFRKHFMSLARRSTAAVLCLMLLSEPLQYVSFADETESEYTEIEIPSDNADSSEPVEAEGESDDTDKEASENSEIESEAQNDSLVIEEETVTENSADSSEESSSEESTLPDGDTQQEEPVSEDGNLAEEDKSFITCFPDEHFRSFLREYEGTKSIFENLTDDSLITAEIKDQLAAIDTLEIFSDDNTTTDISLITDLTGIELFTSLETLDISGTGARNFDESVLPELKRIIKASITDAQFTEESYSAVYNGKNEFKPSLIVKSEDTVLTEGTDYEVSYSDNKNVGTAEVTITGIGNYKGEKKLNFSIYPAAARISAVNNSRTNQLTVNIASVNSGNVKYCLVYSKNEDMSESAEVKSSIKSIALNGIEAGTYYIKIYALYQNGDVELKGEESTVTSVKVKESVSNHEVVLCESSAIYTSNQICPDVTVNGLEKDKDYTVSYSDNINPGTATVTISGIGDCAGTVTKSFSIIPKSVTINSVENKLPGTVTVSISSDNPDSVTYKLVYSENEDFSYSKTLYFSSDAAEVKNLSYSTKYYFRVYAVQKSGTEELTSAVSNEESVTTLTVREITSAVLSKTAYTYTGKALKPNVTVYCGNTKLEKSTDYTVTYSNNKKAGTATVTVKGTGNYSGTIVLNFLIKPQTPAISSINTTDVGSTLTIKLNTSSGASTTLYYSTDKNFESSKSITTSGSEVTIKGLKENTTYYFRARSCVKYNSSVKWTSYSSTVSQKTKISITKCERSVSTKVAYTGKALKPLPTISYNGKKLVKGTDYTLKYTKNKSVGKAFVVITGKGKYVGSITLAFYVIPTVPTVSEAKVKDGTLSIGWTASKGSVAGYSIEYSEDSTFSSKNVKTLNDTKLKVSGLKLGVKYYVRVRSYFLENGAKVYGPYSKTVTSSLSSTKNSARIAVAGKLYKSDSTDSKVLMSLSVGDVVTVLSTSGDMTKVSIGGKTGYILVSLYSMGPKFSGTISQDCKMFSSADSSSSVVKTLSKGTAVTVTAISGSYYKVTSNGKKGYVKKSCVSPDISDGTEQVSSKPSLAVYTGNLKAGAFGVDISEFNGYIDYSKLAGKVDFILIRCGYGTDYSSQDDGCFAYNVSQCEKYGIPYGLYLFSYADTIGDAKSEAQHALRLANACNPTLGVWYDLEWDGMPYDTYTVNGIVSSFCDTLAAAGYRTGIYTYCMFYKSRFVGTNVLNYKIWMAQYNGNNELADISCAWQFTDAYYISGIGGAFDGDYLYGSFFS